MPKMLIEDTDTEELGVKGSSFRFSAVRVEELTEVKYTCCVVTIDTSGSVMDFSDELLECLKSIVKACQSSSMKDFILLRVITFSDDISEVHGFIPVTQIDADSYDPLNCYGCTALFDSAYSAVGSILEYAEQMEDRGDITSNGISFFITDGEDNVSTTTAKMVGDLIGQTIKSEELESFLSFLIGINVADCKPSLEAFANIAKLTEFIDAGNASPDTLARIAKFVSSSVSSQSQALQSGGPSQVLTF